MGQPAKRASLYAVMGYSVFALAGCVGSSINTPQGFVGTLEQPTAADVLAISDEDIVVPTPETRPGADIATAEQAEPAQLADQTETVAPEQSVAVAAATPPPDPDVATQRIESAAAAPLADGNQAPVTSIASVAPVAPIVTPQKSTQGRSGFLSSLFGTRTKRPAAPVTTDNTPVVRVAAVKTPSVQVTAPKPRVVIATAAASGSAASLPGVNRDRALGVSSGSEPVARVQVASAAGLARLAPNGLRTQHAGVDVKCLKPALVRVLKTVEKKFGRPVVVTSGFRSSTRNRKARGAKNSLHIYCAAADIQVAGISKWQLAKYLRSMPGRGGVGTYCHTKSVHIDIGPTRDWNWRCRRKKR